MKNAEKVAELLGEAVQLIKIAEHNISADENGEAKEWKLKAREFLRRTEADVGIYPHGW